MIISLLRRRNITFFFSFRNVKKIFVVGYDVRISYFHIFRLNQAVVSFFVTFSLEQEAARLKRIAHQVCF